MVELVILGVLAMVGVIVFGVLASAAAMIGWLVWLPFRMLGCIFKGLALAITLPLLLITGLAGVVVLGFGLLAFLVPLLPFVAVTLLIVWLMKRRHPARPMSA